MAKRRIKYYRQGRIILTPCPFGETMENSTIKINVGSMCCQRCKFYGGKVTTFKADCNHP